MESSSTRKQQCLQRGATWLNESRSLSWGHAASPATQPWEKGNVCAWTERIKLLMTWKDPGSKYFVWLLLQPLPLTEAKSYQEACCQIPPKTRALPSTRSLNRAAFHSMVFAKAGKLLSKLQQREVCKETVYLITCFHGLDSKGSHKQTARISTFQPRIRTFQVRPMMLHQLLSSSLPLTTADRQHRFAWPPII